MSLLHQIALSLIPGVGNVTARHLLSHCGSAEGVLSCSVKTLQKIPGVGPKTAEVISRFSVLERAHRELEFISKYQLKPLFIGDKDYPARMKNCVDAPVMLYFKGQADFNPSKIISVVGTRKATDYGRELCKQLIADLKPYNPLVVSGLAHGIDSVVHKECLKNNLQTIGVLGHGLDRIYPAQHRTLAGKMVKCGGLLTEFPSETNPDRENFPKRNRIIAGLADAIIVVEASVKGGALITAEIANSYNRDVMAFPGRVNDEYSAGCNYLIKTNRANLISDAKDLEYLLGWLQEPLKEKPQLSLMLNLSAEEQSIADVLQLRGLTAVDELAALTRITQSKLALTILDMEMRGLVISLPGKMYKLA